MIYFKYLLEMKSISVAIFVQMSSQYNMGILSSCEFLSLIFGSYKEQHSHSARACRNYGVAFPKMPSELWV